MVPKIGLKHSTPAGEAMEDERDPDDAPRPAKKQRKQRPCYSCEECRRLKMKCDRRVPCSNCVRRHKAESCNEASHSRLSSSRESIPHNAQSQDAGQFHAPQLLQQPQPELSLHQLEPSNEDVSNLSSSFFVDQPYLQSSEQSHPIDPSQPQLNHQTIIPNRGPEDSFNHVSNRSRPDNQDKLDQLAVLARTLAPTAVRESRTSSGAMASPLNSLSNETRSSSNPASQTIDHDDPGGSYGTLTLVKGGRSNYLGPTAGSEWLKDSEMQDVSATPTITRAPSPETFLRSDPSPCDRIISGTTPIAFPFNTSEARISTRGLLKHLPPRAEGWTLAEAYYRYCAWHHDVVPKISFEKTFDRVFTLSDGGQLSPPVNPQEIALVFIIMAQGTMFNIEMASNDSSTEEWLHLAERALVKGDFLSSNMVAGLQTLHLMAHLHLQMDKGRPGDKAWPLWGLIMRLIQAMGMHRDGARWNLPHDVVEERRKVFWECNAADTFQAHCFSRPCAINPEHCDTAFPTVQLNQDGEKDYSILRYELSQLSSEILNMAMKVRRPDYSKVTELDQKLSEFETNLPYSLRCRAALLSMPSRYPRRDAAIEASPEPSRRSMTISFQQMNLALNISETVINLHRPYYAKALYDDVDGVKSIYAPSYLAVIERCTIIINIVSDIHTRFPTVSVRQWNFWFHVFGSALCLGTLVLRDPGNALASFVLAQIDAAIGLFTSLIQHGASSPRYHRNWQWLVKLRARAAAKISKVSSAKKADQQQDAEQGCERARDDREDGEDVELLGWRTRLIERAGQDRRTIWTIHLATAQNGSQGTPQRQGDLPDPQDQLRIPETMTPGTSVPITTPDSTDDLLRDFWDPMLSQDIFGVSHDQFNPFMNIGPAWWEQDGLDKA